MEDLLGVIIVLAAIIFNMVGVLKKKQEMVKRKNQVPPVARPQPSTDRDFASVSEKTKPENKPSENIPEPLKGLLLDMAGLKKVELETEEDFTPVKKMVIPKQSPAQRKKQPPLKKALKKKPKPLSQPINAVKTQEKSPFLFDNNPLINAVIAAEVLKSPRERRGSWIRR